MRDFFQKPGKEYRLLAREEVRYTVPDTRKRPLGDELPAHVAPKRICIFNKTSEKTRWEVDEKDDPRALCVFADEGPKDFPVSTQGPRVHLQLCLAAGHNRVFGVDLARFRVDPRLLRVDSSLLGVGLRLFGVDLAFFRVDPRLLRVDSSLLRAGLRLFGVGPRLLRVGLRLFGVG